MAMDFGTLANIVVFGVQESSEGTIRQKNDLESISKTLVNLDDSVGANSVRDHFRLGK